MPLCRPLSKVLDGAKHRRLVNLVDLEAAADSLQLRDVKGAAEVLAEFLQPAQDQEPAVAILRDERVVPERETDSFEQSEDSIGIGALEVPHPDRVLEIEGNADRDGFAMA